MRLADLLREPGDHVWPFTRDTTLTTLGDACRRVQSYLQQKQFVQLGARAECTGHIMSNVKTYQSEPVLLISVTHNE